MESAVDDLLKEVLRLNENGFITWFEFAGHVEKLAVRVAHGHYDNVVYRKAVYLDEPGSYSKVKDLHRDIQNLAHAVLPR